jgi:hypothetical protein
MGLESAPSAFTCRCRSDEGAELLHSDHHFVLHHPASLNAFRHWVERGVCESAGDPFWVQALAELNGCRETDETSRQETILKTLPNGFTTQRTPTVHDAPGGKETSKSAWAHLRKYLALFMCSMEFAQVSQRATVSGWWRNDV